MRKYVCSDLKIYTQPDLICPTLAGAGVCSVKVDGVPLAFASRLNGAVPALVESATARLRYVARAGGQRSFLQVVRVACLAARVGRDAAALALGGSLHTVTRKVSARLSARWIEGCLHLFLCAVAGALLWLLWLLWLFFSTFTPAIMGVACFSFLTLGEQGDSSFTVALAEARVDIFSGRTSL